MARANSQLPKLIIGAAIFMPVFCGESNGLATVRGLLGAEIEFPKANDPNRSWIQPVDATDWLNRSAGVS